jgi:glycosyltransferase involved in cell wall biosynthesis
VRIHLFAYWHDARWKGFVGASVKIWDLAGNLAALGHAATLFIPAAPLLPGTPVHGVVRVPYLDLPWLRHLTFNACLALALLRARRAPRPDLIYVRRMNSLVPGLYARLRRIPLVYEVNDDPYAGPGPDASVLARCRAGLQRWRDTLNLRWSAKAFVITDALAARIVHACPGLDPGKLAILPSGANTELFRPLPVGACRQRLGLAPGSPHVGFVGTLLPHQGIEVLIDAAAAIRDRVPGCRFLVIGEGPMRAPWREAAGRVGLAGAFAFPGEVPYAEVPLWIGATDVCVAPFRRTAGLRSPVKIFDYLACGKPVVASRIPGTTDVFAGLPAVRLVAPEEPGALAEAIADLLADPQRARALGAGARSFVVERYDRRALARAVCEAVGDALSAREEKGRP